MAVLSHWLPRLPRATEASCRRWRSARLASCASAGWPVVLSKAITYLPSSLRALAASAAAAICSSLIPASSARLSTTMADAFTSASTFWLNWVPSFDICVLMSRMRAFCASVNAAPPRTKSS
ncbi:MAG: hypothetical protein ABS98_10035 [Lysobacteraceae bacterium SCN 69-48]|nr:MAG: hypothetical protein ABS98_10035 [Xanthomonadaceae bacterium SCN 69-48]